MIAWIRFGLTAVLLLGGILAFAAAMLGNYRFGYVLNRMHAAGIGDSLGMLLVILSLMISVSGGMDLLKLAALIVFLWCTSPVNSHFLARIEMEGDTEYLKHIRRICGEKSTELPAEMKDGDDVKKENAKETGTGHLPKNHSGKGKQARKKGKRR